jgi:hypothetical protein
VSLVRRSTLYIVAGLVVLVPKLFGQSMITGDIGGDVTDATQGVLPGAKVALKSPGRRPTQTTTTNTAGDYRFTLLKQAGRGEE